MLDFLFTLAALLAVIGLAYGAFLCVRLHRVTAEVCSDLAASTAWARLPLPQSDWDLQPRACTPSAGIHKLES